MNSVVSCVKVAAFQNSPVSCIVAEPPLSIATPIENSEHKQEISLLIRIS